MGNEYKILITFDCLVDTRLATLIYLHPDYATLVIGNGYMDRNHNQFDKLDANIPQDRFEEEWNRRDKHILINAKRSNMVNLLKDYIRTSTTTPEYPETSEVSIVINTYPYNMPASWLKEYFSLFRYLFNTQNVARIHAPLNLITLEYLKTNYNRFILHDFDEWLKQQDETMSNFADPNFTIAVPFCRIKDQLDNGLSDDTVIGTLSNAFAPTFDLEFFKLEDISLCKIPVGEIGNKKRISKTTIM